jgi:hypothetical protein
VQPAYGPDGTYADNVGNTTVKINPHGYDDYPEMDVVPELKFGTTELFPSGYVDLPPQPQVCKGTTTRDCWVRVVNVPMVNGGSKAACVQFCRVKPQLPPREVFVPRTPTPAPLPYVEPLPKQPPATPAVRTVIAKPYVEPVPKRPPAKPAVRTVLATPYVEPMPKRPPAKPAVRTVLATPYVEPVPKRPPVKPAVRTVIATPYVEPMAKRPALKPAVPTVTATPAVEPPARYLPR